MKKVPASKVATTTETADSPLSPKVQEALGEMVGAAREGLLALSVGVGLSVVHELMESEITEVVGPKGEHDPDRTAKRHGHEDGSMTLGGRRVRVSRPRMRSADDERELALGTYEHFADRDPLTRAVMDRMLAGVSTRKFAGVGEPVGSDVEEEASATSRTSVSEMFIERTQTALEELMSAADCGSPGHSPTPSLPASGSSCSPPIWIAPGPTRPPRCARGWRRR
jgi:putative transposase